MLDAVCRLVAARWGATCAPSTTLVDHHERVVFVTIDPNGTSVVVKADRDARRLAREAWALRAAGQSACPVPTVRDVIDSDAAVLVMDHIDGQTLWDSPDSAWSTVGRQLRRLHHDVIAPPNLPYFGGGPSWWPSLIALADRELRKPAARALVPPTILDEVHQSVVQAAEGAAEIGVAFIHGDCTPYHWILQAGEVAGLIDFGEAGLGDPAWDHVVLTRWDPGELPRVLAGYGADAAFEAHVHDVYRPYSALRILIALNWLAEHGRDPSPNASELARVVGVTLC